MKNSGKRGNITNKPTLDPFDPDTSYGAPAAFMDIEPNNFTAPDGIVRNVYCENISVKGSGTSAIACFMLSNNPDQQTIPFGNFIFRNVNVEGCFRGAFQTFGDSGTSVPYNILLDGGECTGGTRAGELLAVNGLTIQNYTFRDIPSPLDIGYVGNVFCVGLTFKNVKFIRVGQGTGAGGVRVRGGRNWMWDDVLFEDCPGVGLTFLGGQKFEQSKFNNIRFRSSTPGTGMQIAIRAATFEGPVNID